MSLVRTEIYCIQTIMEHCAKSAQLGIRTEGGHLLNQAALLLSMQSDNVDFGEGIVTSQSVFESIMKYHMHKEYHQLSPGEVVIKHKLVLCNHGTEATVDIQETQDADSKETRH